MWGIYEIHVGEDNRDDQEQKQTDIKQYKYDTAM